MCYFKCGELSSVVRQKVEKIHNVRRACETDMSVACPRRDVQRCEVIMRRGDYCYSPADRPAARPTTDDDYAAPRRYLLIGAVHDA